MAIPTSIEAEIAARMKLALTEYCVTDVEDDDDSKVNEIVVGTPTRELKEEIVLSIHTSHPLGPEQATGSRLDGTRRQNPYMFPNETIGGMKSEVMYGAVQINIRKRLAADEAVQIAGAVTVRIKQAINNSSHLAAFTDELGNFMSEIETYEDPGYQTGGQTVSVYYRWVGWRAFVHSEECHRS